MTSLIAIGLSLTLLYGGCRKGETGERAAVNTSVAEAGMAAGQLAPGKISVRLADGSRLVGEIRTETFDVRTTYGEVHINRGMIRSMAFTDSGRVVTVECSNGDILHGTPSFSTLPVGTSLGNFEIPVSTLSEITFRGSVLEITRGLAAYYPLDGSVVDESGNHHDGANHGATPGIDRFGANGRAMAFDGSGAYVGVPNGLIDPAGSGFTWSVWVLYHETSGIRFIFYGGANTAESALTLNDGLLGFSIRLEGKEGLLVTAAAPPPEKYAHIVCVYRRGESIQLWINGTRQGESPVPDGMLMHGSNVHSAAIGSYAPEQQNHIRTYHYGSWMGLVDDLRIYTRSLTPGEISILAADH